MILVTTRTGKYIQKPFLVMVHRDRSYKPYAHHNWSMYAMWISNISIQSQKFAGIGLTVTCGPITMCQYGK